jgi:hypothetical protein
MLRTMNRLTALSLGTSTPDASHLTRLTCSKVKMVHMLDTEEAWRIWKAHLCITACSVQAKSMRNVEAANAW